MIDYAALWLSLEVIIIPVIYTVGYEMVMDRQRNRYEKAISSVEDLLIAAKLENATLKTKVNYLSQQNKESKQ